MSAAVAFIADTDSLSDTRLPPGVVRLEDPSGNPDLAFLNYIIECFELRTNIRPTVFIRSVPDHYVVTIDQIINNIGNALRDIPCMIPCTQHILVENTTPVFEGRTIRKTEKPTIFGFNLLALLKHVPVAKLRNIRNYFRDHDPQALGHFWFNIVGALAPPYVPPT